MQYLRLYYCTQWTQIRPTTSTTGSWLISNFHQILSFLCSEFQHFQEISTVFQDLCLIPGLSRVCTNPALWRGSCFTDLGPWDGRKVHTERNHTSTLSLCRDLELSIHSLYTAHTCNISATCKQRKVHPHSLTNVEPEADPGVQAVSP